MSNWANIIGTKPKVYWNTVKSCRISLSFDNASNLNSKETRGTYITGNDLLNGIVQHIGVSTRVGQKDFVVSTLKGDYLIKVMSHGYYLTTIDQRYLHRENIGGEIMFCPGKHRLVKIFWY